MAVMDVLVHVPPSLVGADLNLVPDSGDALSSDAVNSDAVSAAAAVDSGGVLIRSQSLPILFAHVERGKSEARDAIENLRRQLAIGDTTGDLVKSITLPLATYRAAAAQAAELSGDEFLGVHAAQEASRGSFGILEFVIRHVPTVERALERTLRYWRLVSEASRLELQRSGGEVALVHRIPEEPLCMGRQGNELTLATLHRLAREITQTDLRATSVEFAHPAPSDLSELEQFFGTRQLRFDCAHNRIAWDESVLALPIPSADERLLAWLDEYATSLLPPEPAAERAVPGLERQIRLCLHESTQPTVAEIARRLRISARTLQRRLCEAHMSFYGVLEGIRCELAETHLHDPTLSIYEVALRLGYANERGFERAFMKWHGLTPRAYRRKISS